MKEGQIYKALSGFYYIQTDEGPVACKARGRFRQAKQTPVVGDLVRYQILGGGQGVVEEILPRRNLFQRPAVANIDQLIIIASGAIPKTDPYLIDRIVSIAVLKQCQVLICLNKSDLDPGDALYEIYQSAGIPIVRVSAKTGEGIDWLKQEINGKLSAFTGNSGVGKSSVLNALDPQYHITEGEISQALGRGKHTTRHVELYPLSCGGAIIDTPGFGSFDSSELDLQLKQSLPETFVEFSDYIQNCRFEDCRHMKEKGCAVRAAVEAGKIQPSRYVSYCRMYEELKERKDWE